MIFVYWLLGLEAPGTIERAKQWLWYAASPPGPVTVAVLILLALAVASLNLLPQNIMRWRMRAALTAVRLAGFAVLAVLLCQVELRLTVDRAYAPNVAVLRDRSGSMGLADVDGQTRAAAARRFEGRLLEAGRGRMNLSSYEFSWTLQTGDSPEGPQGLTRLVRAVDEVARRETDLQAVILLTDGQDTAGDRGQLLAPMLAARRLPVYPVVFGDPDAPRWARVRIDEASTYVRLGDELRLAATLHARDLGEQSVNVKLFQNGRDELLGLRENVRLGAEPIEVAFVVKPDPAGDHTYRIVMEGVRNSVTDRLLAAEHRVQVIDAKIRVLYVDIPRDERKILGNWLARDPVVDLATLTLLPKGGWYAQGALQHKNAGDGLPNQEEDLYRYDVIILGDIPRSYFRAGGDVAETKLQRLADFVSRRGGGLVTLGGRNAYAAGQYQDSALARILPFRVEPTSDPQVPEAFPIQPTVVGLGHPIMQLEWEPTANREAWFDLPRLDGCNRVGAVKPGASLLAVRELPEGPMPVLAIQNAGKGQVLALAFDTTWRWEMMRPVEGEDYFRRFWGNVVRSLAPDPRLEPNRPQVLRYRSRSAVGQTIPLATRLVDAVYQPIRAADLVVSVTSPSGKVTAIYPRDGREAPGLYEYEVALTEPGSWQVATTYKDQTTTQQIVAGDSQEELDDPRARPEVMAEFATATGGRSFTPAQAEELVSGLALTPRRTTETASIAVWNLPAVMVLMIALVSLDCWIRKRRGMA